jgi:hypothetical protein
VNVRWVYAHDYEQYAGGPRQVSIHELRGSWTGASATWNSPPPFDATAWFVTELDDVPDASIFVPVTLDAGVFGLMLRFTSEACPSPRWPAEIVPDPTLEITCP